MADLPTCYFYASLQGCSKFPHTVPACQAALALLSAPKGASFLQAGLVPLATQQPGNATCKATSHCTAALQGEKGRQHCPKEEADTANTAWGQRHPIPQLNTAKDLPCQAELPRGLSALAQGWIALAMLHSQREG